MVALMVAVMDVLLPAAIPTIPTWVFVTVICLSVGYIICALTRELFQSRNDTRFAPVAYEPDEVMLVNMIKAWVSSGPAYSRSHKLLMQSLTPAQAQSFVTRGWFIAIGSRSRGVYRISAASALNVYRDGHCYCAERYDVPIFDRILAQKLMIEFDEPAFLKVANKF